MKKWLFAVGILLSTCLNVNAQTIPDFELIKLEKTTDYKKAEPFALQTAVYMLTTPVVKNNENRMKALEFLFKWMTGTPDHSFLMDDAAATVGRDNKDILGLYMAAMVKYTLTNKSETRDNKLMKLAAVNMVLDYCENKSNNVKMTKSLKKMSEARAKGELEQAL